MTLGTQRKRLAISLLNTGDKEKEKEKGRRGDRQEGRNKTYYVWIHETELKISSRSDYKGHFG